MTHATRRSTKWVAVLSVAAAVRLVSWPHAPPEDPARSPFDGDAHYHRLRAEQIARDFPHVDWRDPDLGDGGIEIPWPPLFDELIAAAARAVGGGQPSRADVAHAAAWAPVVIGVATVPLVGWLAGILLGPEVALGAALIAALSTPHAMFSLLGRSDHHVLELLLTVAILIAYGRGLSAAGARARTLVAVAVGVTLALSFWNWPGSALNLLVLVAYVSAWHVLSPEDGPRAIAPAATLAAGCAAGALVLATTVSLFAPPGSLSRATLLGVSGLHVLLIAATAAFGALLWCARHVVQDATRTRRATEVLGAAALTLAALASLPAARAGMGHGLRALLAGNRWYESIGEFAPMFFARHEPLWLEIGQAFSWYGFVPAFALLGAAVLRDRWHEVRERRPEVLLLATCGALSFGLAVARYRFGLYASAPLAIWAWLGIRFARERWVPRLCRASVLNVAVAVILVSPAGSLAKAYLFAGPKVSPGPLLAWLADEPDPTAARTVYARWSWGHHVRALARRPAVANPFGTDGGASSGLEESLRAFLSTDEQELVRVLRAHDAGYLLNEDPRGDVLEQDALPPGTPAIADVRYHWRTGVTMVETHRYHELVSYRLHAHDGSAVGDSQALGSFRLLRETEPADRTKSDRPAYALYGVVAGARLRVSGAPPGAQIAAMTRVRTNTRREFEWRTTAAADERGTAELRLPYATGENGSCVAAPLQLAVGGRVRSIHVSETAVVHGATIESPVGPATTAVAHARAGNQEAPAVP